ncbi:type I-F CRISPR-associated protein Csy1 [Gilvimarinus algae]|uniref:Type I-F CRISPR-associated protein Csy1 n=1 Tax=Gilvimarinus algae TaxID=3058037 RepID=A0ABT8TGT6_9GAMM|nr:type I-F CRISPR-associated protein Csy1 [Gilvimarinus sp. SDUM040014]MDO3383302.1 type I-F CRISPR-associated protein Csy1 [Gilvimarinus sp. SDUM040014]
MHDNEQSSSRSAVFRQAITEFIDERRDTKLNGLSDEKAAEVAAKYDYDVWLESAAKRVSQIQAVTHITKATHPDAKGSSLYVSPKSLPERLEVGTHVLGDDYAEDVVGNAAALDVYKFLKLEVDGKRLIEWFQQNDTDAIAALHSDEGKAAAWAESFKELIRPVQNLASHVMAKQVYWCAADDPTDNAGFHLLQPLFSSPLAHAVHSEVNDARFGEVNKAARQARSKKQPHDGVYKVYTNVAVRKLGGTKPQNISQLNSERGGVNYLLASAPPQWTREWSRSPLNTDTSLNQFFKLREARDLFRKLVKLLKSDPNAIMETRQKREAIEQALGQSLAAYGAELQAEMEPGWTRDAACRLPLCEKIWLDQARATLPIREEYRKDDEAFLRAFEWKDWPDEVASLFANQVNARLIADGLPVGDAEHAHWAKQAIVNAAWPATIQRRAIKANKEVANV